MLMLLFRKSKALNLDLQRAKRKEKINGVRDGRTRDHMSTK